MVVIGAFTVVVLIASAYADWRFKIGKARSTRQSTSSGLGKFDKSFE